MKAGVSPVLDARESVREHSDEKVDEDNGSKEVVAPRDHGSERVILLRVGLAEQTPQRDEQAAARVPPCHVRRRETTKQEGVATKDGERMGRDSI